MCGYIIATEIRGATTNSLDAQHRKHAKCMYGRRFGEGHTEQRQNIGGDGWCLEFGSVQGLCFREVGLEGTGTNWFLKKHCCACNGISLFMYQIRSEASQFHTHPASFDKIYIYICNYR